MYVVEVAFLTSATDAAEIEILGPVLSTVNVAESVGAGAVLPASSEAVEAL